MKLKYYLRGVGMGIISTTIILTIAFANKKVEMSDDEIKLKAAILGMISVEEADELDGKIANLENEKVSLEKEIEELNMQINALANVEDTTSEEKEEVEEVTDEENNEVEAITGEANTETQNQAVVNGEDVSFSIAKGMGSETVAQILEDNGLIPSATEFNKYLVNGGYSDMIQIGEYVIPVGATYDEIVDIIIK